MAGIPDYDNYSPAVSITASDSYNSIQSSINPGATTTGDLSSIAEQHHSPRSNHGHGAGDASGPESGSESETDEQTELDPYKPKVIVRIRPSATVGKNVFKVDPETKTIKIKVDSEDKANKHLGINNTNKCQRPPDGYLHFPADVILDNSSQEDTFNSVLDVVENAMKGVPGMIMAIGSENSGKSFSLFGLHGRFRNRGIVPRAMEKLFELKKSSECPDYDVRFNLGFLDVRRERVKNLMTLDHKYQEINEGGVGERGYACGCGSHGKPYPLSKDSFMEEMDCLEYGIGLLLRGLIGQKMIHTDRDHRYHTIVYIDILQVSKKDPKVILCENRLTFAEITSPALEPEESDKCTPPYNPPKPRKKPEVSQSCLTHSYPYGRCCNPGYATSGQLSETIAVRRDIFALEHIFQRAHDAQKVRDYWAKLESLGLPMIASEKKKMIAGYNARQSKLALCLKDVLSSNVRILLHVIPEKSHLKPALEAMRFAERARQIPSNVDMEKVAAMKEAQDRIRKEKRAKEKAEAKALLELEQAQQQESQPGPPPLSNGQEEGQMEEELQETIYKHRPGSEEEGDHEEELILLPAPTVQPLGPTPLQRQSLFFGGNGNEGGGGAKSGVEDIEEHFEEMKRVARRQAGQLLKLRVKKPEWKLTF